MQKIHIRATPNSSKNQIIGWQNLPNNNNTPNLGPILCLKISAPPTQGKANQAIHSYLAQLLHTPPSSISLQKGNKSRIKTFLIPQHLNPQLLIPNPPNPS